jgi:glycosyltransferase involved in cell wall biosynthesis
MVLVKKRNSSHQNLKNKKLKKVIITTTNNLVFDNRVYKITLTLIEMGFSVLQTGRDFPHIKNKQKRPGEQKLFKLPVNKGPLFYVFINLYTFLFLLFHKYDLIWAVDMDTLPGAKTAAFLRRKPIVFDGHEFFSETPELQHRKHVKRIWYFLEKVFLPGCDRYFTVSPGLVKLYKEHFNIDFRLLRNLPIKREGVSTLSADETSKIIIYQGVLNVGRGIEQTIEALKYLPDDYRFVVVGRGDCSDEFQQLTKKLKLEHRVDFIGPVPFEELFRYQKNALVGICTHENLGLNYYYSLPNRLFDYMQAGIPVITSEFPDMAEIVRNNETGLVLETLEPKEVAKVLKEACENQQLRKKWMQTIPMAAEKYIWNNEKQVMADIPDLVK